MTLKHMYFVKIVLFLISSSICFDYSVNGSKLDTF